MATAAQIQTWIDEAEAQRHLVALGGAVIDVWKDGRRLRKQVPDIAALDAYIAQLRSELVAAQVAEGITPTPRRRAIGLSWSN